MLCVVEPRLRSKAQRTAHQFVSTGSAGTGSQNNALLTPPASPSSLLDFVSIFFYLFLFFFLSYFISFSFLSFFFIRLFLNLRPFQQSSVIPHLPSK